MQWDNNLTNLNYILAGYYPFKQESLAVARRAGLNVLNINFHDKPITNWYYILDEALKTSLVVHLIDTVLMDYPNDERLLIAKQGGLSGIQGATIEDTGGWKDTDLSEDNLEKIIGKESTLLDIAYLEVGLEKAKSVVRIELSNGATGSGFLIDNNFIITNNHVIPDLETAKECAIQFNYQRSKDGLDLKVHTFKTDPDNGFATNSKDKFDWTVVKLKEDANKKWGALPLRKNEIEKNDRVTIIQHPNGLHKQIAFYHNFVRYVDENVVQYLTDTLPGSSGSPVFDADWNLIALHHSGGNIREPGTKRLAFRNEGIHINRVIEGIQKSGVL